MTTKSKPTPNYNTHIPPEILTSDEVETSIGTLEFLDGVPLPEIAQKAYDYLDTMRGVPVYGFWSVTLYDDEGWLPVNKYDAYSFNNVTAKKDKDGSITIHFGGDPKADNFLPIVPGWNYIVRLYQPGQEILNGSWTFPDPEAVE